MKLKELALRLLGITSFTKQEGKDVITQEQETALGKFLDPDQIKSLKDELAKEVSSSQTVTQLQAELTQAQADLRTEKQSNQANAQKIIDLNATIERLTNQIDALMNSPEDDKPKQSSSFMVFNPKSTHLFGANTVAIMAIDDKRVWNARAQHALALKAGDFSIPEPNKNATFDYDQLADDFDKYIKLVRSNLGTLPMPADQTSSLFNTITGISDKATGFNLLLDELSQAAQDDFVSKGNFTFSPETQPVYDVEFNYIFRDLKKLERNWIGMITNSTAPSDPVKLSFVAFILNECLKKLVVERDQRRMCGIRVEPVQGVPGKSINGSNGLFTMVREAVSNSLKIKSFPFGPTNSSNIVAHIKNGTALIPALWRNMVTCYVPTGTLRIYNDQLNAMYGAGRPNRDDIDYVDGYKEVKIIELPYSESMGRIFWTMSSNINWLENQPNEMLNFRLVTKTKTVEVISSWKEGALFNFIGKKENNVDDLNARGYDQQIVWATDSDFSDEFFLELTKDSATPNEGLTHYNLVGAKNTNDVTLTNIGVSVGVELTIKNLYDTGEGKIKLNNSGNFSLLPSPWDPQPGEIIRLIKRSDGKFIEIERITELSKYIQLAADATTINASTGTMFLTGTNTQATAIASISNTVPGIIYEIRGNGGSSNATTIASNNTNFVLTAAFTATQNAYIKLVKTSTGKLAEIERG